MKSTQLKKSRKWNSMIASRSIVGENGPFTPPRYSHVYLLKTVAEENSKGSWHGWDITLEGQIEDMAHYATSKAFNESIGSGDVKVKHTQEGADDDKAPF
jgi:hypothetical protein